jgi:hypothetical protein
LLVGSTWWKNHVLKGLGMADIGPIDLTRLTWYGPAKDIMDRWARQFVQLANSKPGEAINDPAPATLRPF